MGSLPSVPEFPGTQTRHAEGTYGVSSVSGFERGAALTTIGSIVFLTFILSPSVPLLVAFGSLRQSLTPTQRRNTYWMCGALAGLTAFSALAFYHKAYLGADYSLRRYIVIYLNLFLAAGLAVTCAKLGLPNFTKKALFLSATLLTAVWLFHAAISAVV